MRRSRAAAAVASDISGVRGAATATGAAAEHGRHLKCAGTGAAAPLSADIKRRQNRGSREKGTGGLEPECYGFAKGPGSQIYSPEALLTNPEYQEHQRLLFGDELRRRKKHRQQRLVFGDELRRKEKHCQNLVDGLGHGPPGRVDGPAEALAARGPPGSVDGTAEALAAVVAVLQADVGGHVEGLGRELDLLQCLPEPLLACSL